MSKYDDNNDIIDGEILAETPPIGDSADVLEGEIIINRAHTPEDDAYEYAVRKGWWVLLLRGVVLTAMGLAALLVPNAALNLLALLIGVYIVFDGGINVVNALRRSTGRGAGLVRGLVGVGIGGLIVAFSPQLVNVTSNVIVFIIAGFFLLAGLLSVLGALRAGRVRWVSLVAGIVFLGLGALMFINPDFFTNTFVRVVGAFILLAGILVMIFSLKLRQLVQ